MQQPCAVISLLGLVLPPHPVVHGLREDAKQPFVSLREVTREGAAPPPPPRRQQQRFTLTPDTQEDDDDTPLAVPAPHTVVFSRSRTGPSPSLSPSPSPAPPLPLPPLLAGEEGEEMEEATTAPVSCSLCLEEVELTDTATACITMPCCAALLCCTCLSKIEGARIAKRCPTCLVTILPALLTSAVAAVAVGKARATQLRKGVKALLSP